MEILVDFGCKDCGEVSKLFGDSVLHVTLDHKMSRRYHVSSTTYGASTRRTQVAGARRREVDGAVEASLVPGSRTFAQANPRTQWLARPLQTVDVG